MSCIHCVQHLSFSTLLRVVTARMVKECVELEPLPCTGTDIFRRVSLTCTLKFVYVKCDLCDFCNGFWCAQAKASPLAHYALAH